MESTGIPGADCGGAGTALAMPAAGSGECAFTGRATARAIGGPSSARVRRNAVQTLMRATSCSRPRPEDLACINKWVNDSVKPITDLEHWGVVERWNYPDDGYGDCEDYVLLKRRMLMQSGWPRQALLITVVRDKRGDGHAVLTVKTDKGELILDNQHEDILLWSDTSYRFVKRQSQSDPNVWIALGDPRPATATATSR
jgi:predicted transglutaminase-like cysteine proteinase